jgi:transcriptional regulator with XRE-family HTH domain
MSAKKHSPEHLALGRAVLVARARQALSQDELGSRSGLHRNYIGAMERGEINATFAVLLKLARGLDMPLSRLVAEAEQLRQESHFRATA